MAFEVKKYLNPPIQEAICEIHFDSQNPLPIESLERIRQSLTEGYPDQKIVAEQNIHFQVNAEEIKTENRTFGNRLICKSEDGGKLVQVSGLFFAVNQLKPYPGWNESFKSIILARAEDISRSIGDFRFKRVGLRYINKIDIPQVPLKWTDWFTGALPVPSFSDGNLAGMQMHFAFTLPRNLRINVNVVSLNAETNVSPVLLDLDVIWEGESTALSTLPIMLENVHTPHRFAFEAYLNDRLRSLFQPL